MTLRFRGVFVLAFALLSSCSVPLRIVEDPIDPRTVGERAPGTRLETDEDSSLPTLPPTLQSARRRLLGIAALIAHNGLQERRSPDLLWLATQALGDEPGSQGTPVHEKGGVDILFDALPTNGRVLLLPERERSTGSDD